MTGKPSPSPGDAIGLGVADLKVSTCAASSREAFKSKPLESHARDVRATFWVEENFSQAFFCHCLGRGKFQAKLFFPLVSGNPPGGGVFGGGGVRPRLCGAFARRGEGKRRR